MFREMWIVINKGQNYRVYQRRVNAIDKAISLVCEDRLSRGIKPPYNINNCIRNDFINYGQVEGIEVKAILVEEFE